VAEQGTAASEFRTWNLALQVLDTGSFSSLPTFTNFC